MKKLTILLILIFFASFVSAFAAAPEEISFNALIQALKTARRPIVVDVYATWCGPCKRFAPIFEDVASQYPSRATFCKMDIDRNPEISQALEITSVPTLLILYIRDGKLRCEKSLGFITESELTALLNKTLKLADGSSLEY